MNFQIKSCLELFILCLISIWIHGGFNACNVQFFDLWHDNQYNCALIRLLLFLQRKIVYLLLLYGWNQNPLLSNFTAVPLKRRSREGEGDGAVYWIVGGRIHILYHRGFVKSDEHWNWGKLFELALLFKSII